jgi:TPR repeat protein
MRVLIMLCFFAVSAFSQGLESMGFISNSEIARQKAEQEREYQRQVEQDRIDHLWATDPFRVINGTVVSANESRWVRFYGRVFDVRDGMIFIDGGFKNFQGTFVVINYPRPVYVGFVLDKTNALNALPVASIPMSDGAPLMRLDYCHIYIPHAQPVDQQTEDSKKAANQAKSLKYWKPLAEAGDADGEWRMGEMYRDGEGVPKDQAQARAWLTKAAAQGQKSAISELASLPADPQVTPSASASR